MAGAGAGQAAGAVTGAGAEAGAGTGAVRVPTVKAGVGPEPIAGAGSVDGIGVVAGKGHYNMKIKKLTKKQISKLPECREKWLKIGLSVEKADRSLAEKAVDEAYEKVGLIPPKIKIWLMSPMQGVIGAEYLRLLVEKIKITGIGAQVTDQVRNQVMDQAEDQVEVRVWNQVLEQVEKQVFEQVEDQVEVRVWNQVLNQVGNQVREQVRNQVGAQVVAQVRDQVCDQVRDQVVDQVRAQVVDQVWDQVVDQVRDQLMDQVRDQVRHQIDNQVWEQVGNQVRAQVWEQVRNQIDNQVRAQVCEQVRHQIDNQVWDQIRAQVWEQVWRAGYGSHDANWLGFFEFFKQELNFEICDKLTPLMKLAEHCGWWWPFKGAVILTEKPNSIHRDQENRLHSMTEAALSYPDGWRVYAIHGVRVPEKYILTPADKINPEEVMKESNAEIRMAVIRKCGFAHFKNNLKHKVISASNGNELIEFELEGAKVRGLKVSWLDKHSFKETILPVARTKSEFEEWAFQMGVDFIPDDIDDCEQVRKFTVKMRPSESFLIET